MVNRAIYNPAYGNLLFQDNGDGTVSPYIAGRLKTAGIVASANFTPAAATYGVGAIIDAVKELAFTFAETGEAIPPGALIRITSAVTKIDVNAVPATPFSHTLRLYASAPSVVLADQATWLGKSADLAIYRGPLALGAPVDEGDFLYIKQQYTDTDIRLGSGLSSLQGRLVTDAAGTFTAVARQVFLYGFVY